MGTPDSVSPDSVRLACIPRPKERVQPLAKVLLISFSTLPTMQKYLYNASDELADLGHQIWTAGSANLRAPYVLGPRNVVVSTPATPRPSVKSLWSSKRSLDTVVELIERVQPDVIHFVNKHVWNYLLLRRVKWRGIDTRWVHTFHDPIGHDGDSVQRGVIAYHKVIQRELDAIIVHSKTALSQTQRVLRPKCLVASVPLGDKRWKDYEAVDPRATKRALVFGRLNLYKGCTMYPEIFGEVHRLDPAIQITVAGQPSNELSADLIDRIAACPNVHFDGHFIEEDALENYFREASVVLTPYTSMTQSGVVLDAYCHSRSILAFHIDGMREFLPEGANAVTPFDTREYAGVLVKLLNDPDACARAGREAWEFGREQFSPASMAAGFASVYDDVTGGPVVRPSEPR
jgi:glycosyltransferase involved in cell wall biosynthesis